MKMTLNVEVSFYETLSTQNPVTRNLFNLLTDGSFAEQVATVRNEPDKAKKTELKKRLPAFTPSGVFASGKEDSLISHTGLICIDIDKGDSIDVENFDQMKTLIAKVPFVAFCARSVGGEGFYCIIPIKHPEKHRQHFRSLQMDFARCGVTIDKSCINVSRDRFVSYDPDYYYNPDAEVYDRYISDSKPAPATNIGPQPLKGGHITPVMVDNLIAVIEEREIDITEDYNDWFAIGCSFANYFGEEGRARFHTVSQFYPGYSPVLTDEKFDDALREGYNYNIGTFIHYAHKAGVTALADFSDTTEESI